MAKVTLSFPIATISGKICKHENVILTNRNGSLFMSKRCNKRSTPPTDDELARRAQFAAAWQEVRNTLADPAKKELAIQGFKAQSKYKTLNGYVFAQTYANM